MGWLVICPLKEGSNLTNEELATAIKEGHNEYVPALWDQVIKFIHLLAVRWKRAYPDSLCELEDLIQSGFIAMMKAMHYYDPDKEYKFSTYLTLTLKSAFAEASGTRSERQKRNTLIRTVSLDAPLGGDEDNDLLLDMIADPDAEAPFDRLVLSAEQQMIREVLSDAADRLLSVKQRVVFNEMLASDQRVTAVASANGMSVQVVSRLKNEAFWKLKTDAQVQKLYAHVFGLEDDLTSESLSGTGLTSFKNTGLSVVERVTFRRMGIGKRMLRISTGVERERGYTAKE